jgi:hypothetical protein
VCPEAVNVQLQDATREARIGAQGVDVVVVAGAGDDHPAARHAREIGQPWCGRIVPGRAVSVGLVVNIEIDEVVILIGRHDDLPHVSERGVVGGSSVWIGPIRNDDLHAFGDGSVDDAFVGAPPRSRNRRLVDGIRMESVFSLL